MNKIIRIGTVKTWSRGKWASVYCKIEFDNMRLSITGVIGPDRRGNAAGGAGQIHGELIPSNFHFAEGWNAARLIKFKETWERWHLNDMRAGCEHQEAEGWGKKSITLTKPELHEWRVNAELKPFVYRIFAKALEAARSGEVYQPVSGAEKSWFDAKIIEIKTETKTSGWVKPSEHPQGELCKPCPVCGYKYGTAWNLEKVPEEVISWLFALPDSDKVPAWL